MGNPRAYLLTWTAYGAWLHGDERGSVDDRHNAYGAPNADGDRWRRQWSASRLTEPPFVLSPEMRDAVDRMIRKHCSVRGWPLVALNVRSNHVHAVVGWRGKPPERVMTELKSWSTRALKQMPDARGADVSGPTTGALATSGPTSRSTTQRDTCCSCNDALPALCSRTGL